jgi:hypothetical protein
MIPYCEQFLDNDVKPVVVVVLPLNASERAAKTLRCNSSDSIAISKDFVHRLKTKETSEEVSRLQESDYWFVLGHPEQLLAPKNVYFVQNLEPS